MEHDNQQALKLLQEHRSLHEEDKRFSSIRSSFTSQDYTYQEINHVLGEVVDADGPIGVIKALLTLGADVNFVKRRRSNTWSKITRKQEHGQRNTLLQHATTRCRAEVVYAIAGHADQENLDSVLHHAIVRGDLGVVQALLDHGANPVQLHDDFQNAISQNQVALVQVLLSGHRLPCLPCRSAGLRLAVKNRSLDITLLLLKCWADVNHDGAIALLNAVQIPRPDLVAVLISGPVRPSPRSLDAAIGQAHGAMSENDTKAEREIIEICLSAGAAGPETTRLITDGVVKAVQLRHIQLLDTIFQFRKPPGHHEAVALIEAIRMQHVDILVKLLEFDPSPASLTLAVSQAIATDDPQLRYKVTELLIQSGAVGPCTAEALIKVVKSVIVSGGASGKAPMDKEMDKQLFCLLLNEGKADVNHENGEALQLAVRTSRIDIAEEIMARKPSADSLGAVLPWAMNIPDKQRKQAIVKLLLRDQINQDATGKALVETFRDDPRNTSLIELLLTRACANYNNGEVFIYAIRNFHADNFGLLLRQGLGYKALFTAVMEALQASKSNRWTVLNSLLVHLQVDHLNTALKHVILERDADYLDLASMLLDAGAEATHESGVCIRNASCNLDCNALRLLSEHSGRNVAIFTQAFVGVVNRGKQWIAFEHVGLIQLLVRHGASGQTLNKAMVEVVDYLACDESRADLADILLKLFLGAGADINYENGKAVGIVASRGDPLLLSCLLSYGATSATATLALSTAIMAHHKELLLLRLIDVFVDKGTAVPDVNQSLPGMPPPILLCLKSYNNSVALLDRLVAAGCSLESTIPFQVYTNEVDGDKEDRTISFSMEPVSVLMWAILQPGNLISSPIINALIHHGADVSYTTPKTRTTPLLLAAKCGRSDIVQSLLESGARISARDVLGRSSLFFASQAGNEDLVALLLHSNPSANDGSLHEASRSFHVHIMTHASGRSRPQGVITRDVAIAEKAVEILCVRGASPLLKIHGKTIIFLALDNQDNEPMARMLLDKLLYRTLNSQENIFQQGVYHYSPTMYVAKGILLGPQTDSLIQLLRDQGGEDRYYATMGETQPMDAVGLPEEIKEYERERQAWERRNRQAEEEHTNYLRRETEKAYTVDHIEDLHHNRSVRHNDDLTVQQLSHMRLGHNQVLTMTTEQHLNKSLIKAEEAQLDSSIRRLHHNDELSMTSMTRNADFSHRQRVHEQGQFERNMEERQQHQFRQHRHLQHVSHSQKWHKMELSANENFGRQRLKFAEQGKALDYVYTGRNNQLDMEHRHNRDALKAGKEARSLMFAQDRHQMQMHELKTQRGNIIGQVNLDELRRWQQSQGAGGGGVGNGIRQGVGGMQGRMLT
ncbi:hypothetical protein B0T17DRAFT_650881 [Bombardia bombarda]|uniref:Uncharacterized protein n=1 Tax=Bombardia bombarda TaxID=252184 RepID=A0AA39XL24_9PEZI|nr:hypothetical protein B0T17DRAFT_650881 [Bombardia bombarda]